LLFFEKTVIIYVQIFIQFDRLLFTKQAYSLLQASCSGDPGKKLSRAKRRCRSAKDTTFLKLGSLVGEVCKRAARRFGEIDFSHV